MASLTVEQFLAGVKRSGLIEPTRFAAFLEAYPQLPPSPEWIAELLVRDDLLTPFHVKHMLAGKFAGFVLGQYRVLERIGAGGMGVIFRAEHSTLRRQVAIKVLPPSHASNEESLQRFYREARLVAALDHPNIVRAYDAAKANGIHFLAMEYIEGMDLEKIVCRDGALPVELASGYISQAAAGLQHAHERGLVHRDIKPANLLIDANGALKILDLGLARFFHDVDDGLTKDMSKGGTIGTADYMSPEQAVDSHEVDIRGDIYSLGATFYMLLIGRAPYSQSNVTQKLLAHQLREPEPLSNLRRDVPAEVVAIIARMMGKRPKDRFQTPAEVIEALRPWSGMLPEVSISSHRLPAVPEPFRRSRLAAIVGIGAIFAILLWLKLSSLTEHEGPVVVYPVSVPEVRPTPAPVAIVPIPTPPPVPTPPVPIPTPPPIPTPAPATTPREVGRYRNHTGAIERLAMTQDRKFVLSCSRDKSVRLWDVATRQEVRRFDGHEGFVRIAVFSPTQSHIASTDITGTILVHDTASGRETARMKSPMNVWALRWTKDGRSLVEFGDDGVGRLWDVATRSIVRTFEGHKAVVNWLEIGADGKTVWTADWNGRAAGWNVENGERRFEVGFEGITRLNALALAPDGNELLVASSGPAKEKAPFLIRMNAVNGRPLQKWFASSDDIYMIAFSPDGKRFACVGRSGTVRVYRLWEIEPMREFRWAAASTSGFGLTWKDDRTLLVCGDLPEIVEWSIGD